LAPPSSEVSLLRTVGVAMTGRTTYISSGALFASLGAGALATRWFTHEIGETGLHGPVGFVAAVPFILVFVVGALVLAMLVFKARLGFMPTIIGFLPFGVLILALLGLALVSVAAS
jgi:hypothetical protein